MPSKSKWISGKEIVADQGIKDFELFTDLVKKGLQPYNDLGRSISPEDVLRSVSRVEDLTDRGAVSQGDKDLERELKHAIDCVMEVKGRDWADIDLPPSGPEARQLITALLDHNFRREEVEAFLGQPASDSHGKAKAKATTGRKLRPNQKHRIECRKAAKQLWADDPTITIIDMAMRDEIAHACEPRTYNEDTLRDWIKDLCPNRSPGRRPKKSQE